MCSTCTNSVCNYWSDFFVLTDFVTFGNLALLETCTIRHLERNELAIDVLSSLHHPHLTKELLFACLTPHSSSPELYSDLLCSSNVPKQSAVVSLQYLCIFSWPIFSSTTLTFVGTYHYFHQTRDMCSIVVVCPRISSVFTAHPPPFPFYLYSFPFYLYCFFLNPNLVANHTHIL